MGMYSGQKPRLGIWALAQARTENVRMIFPNMSDDDLPRIPVGLSTFIYIIAGALTDRFYPLCVTHVLVLLRYSPRPESLGEQTMVIGQWWCAYEYLLASPSWSTATKNQKCKIHYATSKNERYFQTIASPFGYMARARSSNYMEWQWFPGLNNAWLTVRGILTLLIFPI